MEKKTCFRQKCGKEFTPSKKKQIYCSNKCRTYAYRETLEKVAENNLPVNKDRILSERSGHTVEDIKYRKMPLTIEEVGGNNEHKISDYLAARQKLKNGNK